MALPASESSPGRWPWAIASISGVIACGFVVWLSIAHRQALATIASLERRNDLLYNEVVAMRDDAARHYRVANEMAADVATTLGEIDRHVVGKERLMQAVMSTYGWTRDTVDSIYSGALDPFDEESRPASRRASGQE